MKKLLSTLAVASMLAVGSVSVAFAADQSDNAKGHGSSVSEVAKAAQAVGELTHSDQVLLVAKGHGEFVSNLAKAQGAVASAAGKAKGSAASEAGAAGQAHGLSASEPGRLKAAAGQANRP